jgi:CYTH domain-containing protein
MIPEIRGLDTETGDPKYARTEFERRWLVDPTARPALDGVWTTRIEDRYIDGTRLRLRQMSRPDLGETKWKLTKKYVCEDASARPIVTSYLTAAEHDTLRALPARELVKTRYHLSIDGHWWSLDLFEGPLEGLELVESEADDAAALAALVPPPWATKEVTHDPRYQGGSLAQSGTIPNAIPE